MEAMANNPPLVLIVDDEPEIRELYGAKLTRAGYAVDSAENGEIGVQKAKEKQPDLVLMDLKMPVMDGMEAFSKLREDPATKDLKVIFLTAFGDPHTIQSDIKFAKEMSVWDYIKKGESLDNIVARVKQAIEGTATPLGGTSS